MEFKKIYINELNPEELSVFTGVNNANLNQLSELHKVDLSFRDNILMVFDKDEYKFDQLKNHVIVLIDYIHKNNSLDYNFIKQSFIDLNNEVNFNVNIGYTNSGKPVKAKTRTQYNFINEIKKNELVFAIGPAGTGKTFLAVLMAVQAFKNGEIKRIVLTRPAVEAGESLGFLPGDLKEKVDPYLMPLYDSLNTLLGEETVNKLIEKKTIEVIPLAYMRGRTLDESFIILDEAQNTTASQMLMFLSRLGFNSKMVVNGDITQIDLKINHKDSGLVVAKNKLSGLSKISFIEFKSDDIVRNPLVQIIIEKFQEK